MHHLLERSEKLQGRPKGGRNEGILFPLGAEDILIKKF